MEKEVPVMAVKKALDLLETLHLGASPHEGMQLSEIARQMGMHANSARNILKTMIVCGYVEQNAVSRYLPGPKCRQMGSLNRLTSGGGASLVKGVMEAFTERTGEAGVYTTLLGGRRVVVSTIDPKRAVKVDRASIDSENIYKRPTGRIMAAYASPAELEQIIAIHGMPGASWDGISDKAALKAALAELREKGECVMPPEGEIVGIAVPVLDKDGSLLGSAGCYAPLFRCPEEKVKEILADLKLCAKDLGRIDN